jgi:hypothetical protein
LAPPKQEQNSDLLMNFPKGIPFIMNLRLRC